MSGLTTVLGIVDAHAEANAAPNTMSGLTSMLPMLVIFVVFMYVMIVRPQSKRAKEQKALLENLKKGDEILTLGGMLGKIEKIDGNFLVINIANNVAITVQKQAVVSCVPKGTLKSID